MILRLPSKRIITILEIFCCLILPIIISCGSNSPERKKPVAVKGTIDLKGWDFQRDGSLNLDGEWEFHWNRLLEPSDFTAADKQRHGGYLTVPGLWKGGIVNGVTLPGMGQGTYRLQILSGPSGKQKTIILHRLYSAYRLWINKKLVDERGCVDGRSNVPENYVFIHNKRYLSFAMKEGVNEVVIQVSNRDYESGGIDRPVLLENEEATIQRQSRTHTVDMVVFGLLIFASVYNILFYFFRRQDSASLYFGFFCLILAVNTLNHQFPILPVGLAIPQYPYYVNYITVVISVPFIQMTIKSLFPEEMSTYFVRFYQVLAALYVVVLFFVDFKTAEQLIRVYFILGIILTIYNAYVLVKVIIKRRADAILFVFGFTPVFAGAVNDILYAMWIVNTTTLTQYGVVILCVVITMVISRRFSRALWKVERLSEDLADKNISLRQLDRIKDQFLANTSHELRTPLHGMIGLTESILEDPEGSLSPKVRENLSLVASSGHRLADMVNDLLDMAKMQDEGLSLNMRPVDLHSLSEMVVKLSLPLAGGKPLKLINDIGSGIPAAHADEDRIRQVLCNLVGNAIKFTPRGSIVLSARVIHRPGSGDKAGNDTMIEVRVSDTGIGIPEEYREKIFEAYRQVDGGDTRLYPGTGLGLAIAKQIVALHGGAIRVEPGEGVGSVFIFTLPVSKETAHETDESDIITGITEAPMTGGAADSQLLMDDAESDDFFESPVLLVVDDDPVCLRVIQNYFESRRCIVKTVPDGISAIEIIERGETIDLVLLDIMMPVMSGYDVCKRIRLNRSPEELPVIMLTAKNMMADIDAAFDAGANDYIVKPFRVKELLARVNTMLKLRNVRRTAAEGITVNDRNRAYFIPFRDIYYVTAYSRNIIIHTVEQDIRVPLLIKEIINRLPPDMFVQIHKSHIVNIRYVHSISHVSSGRYRVRLRDNDDTEIPVGRLYLDTLRKKIQ